MIKSRIKGDLWSFKIISDEEMAKLRDDGHELGALCISEDRTVYFTNDRRDFATVKHELFHAYVSYLHLVDTNKIELDDVEEIFAGMFTADAEKIIRQARRITKAMSEALHEN